MASIPNPANKVHVISKLAIFTIVGLGGIYFLNDLVNAQISTQRQGLDSMSAVNITDVLFDDYFPFITVEYEGNATVVLRGDEESLLLLNGTLAPFWEAIDIVSEQGYSLKDVATSGMGSKGNPTRFYAVMSNDSPNGP